MDYIELIEEVRAELLRVVNQRCDDMIWMYQNGEPYNRSEISSRECRLGRTSPSMLKGKRPVSVTFASGESGGIQAGQGRYAYGAENVSPASAPVSRRVPFSGKGWH